MFRKGQTSIKSLNVALLRIDHSYQRDLRAKFIEAKKTAFNMALVNVLEVSERADGTYFVLDGQHRVALLRAVGVKTVECRIHHGLTSKEEAGLFREFNRQRNQIDLLDDFRAALHEEEVAALAIRAICKDHGFTIAKCKATNPDKIGCVGDLRTIYTRGDLDRVLRLARGTWGSVQSINSGKLLAGISIFLRVHGTKKGVTDKEMMKSWARATPDHLIALATQYRGNGAMLAALTEKYNFNRTTNRLGGMFLVEEVAA